MALGDRLKGLVGLFETFEELLPVILKLVECFQKMSVEDQQRVKAIMANQVSDEQKPTVEKIFESLQASGD